MEDEVLRSLPERLAHRWPWFAMVSEIGACLSTKSTSMNAKHASQGVHFANPLDQHHPGLAAARRHGLFARGLGRCFHVRDRQAGAPPYAARPVRIPAIVSESDARYLPGRPLAKNTDGSTLKPLCGQLRMFSTTSGSISGHHVLLVAARHSSKTASCHGEFWPFARWQYHQGGYRNAD